MENTETTLRLLSQIARLPLDVLALGVELVFRTIQGLQATMTPGLRATTGSSAPSFPTTPGSGPREIPAPYVIQPPGVDPRTSASSSFREIDMMDDQDLSGDDLKVVRYRVLFTKPDLEITFKEEQELINYPTNGGSLGGLKVAHFMGDVEKHKVQRPPKWKESGNDYPPGAKGDMDWKIPHEDERYIEFQYEVIRREPKQDPNYDRDRNREIRRIQKSIDDLANRFGPPPGP
jgi:hypothetical protein